MRSGGRRVKHSTGDQGNRRHFQKLPTSQRSFPRSRVGMRPVALRVTCAQ
ncbi:hypothetical protein C4J91_0232 [Pseudomonas sp. R3-52-08]|nr:hypothetical protein C4J91_0232 [Pseudomonas sp. R3-52-08]